MTALDLLALQIVLIPLVFFFREYFVTTTWLDGTASMASDDPRFGGSLTDIDDSYAESGMCPPSYNRHLGGT